MNLRAAFLLLCAAAALVPLASRPAATASRGEPQWPASFDGKPLRAIQLTEVEERFNAGFPGSIARFTDGERQFIFRWITSGTRKVHPAADCFRGLGYSVHPAPPVRDSHGQLWSRFAASRGADHLRVRERITSLSSDEAWTDVSAWFWSTLHPRSRGPWLAVTLVESRS
jgi:hypothetical protein